MRRRLGGRDVSALGLGCWAIGGPFHAGGEPLGWGEVDDAESIRAIRRALDLGVTVFDTAAVYGAGHSERVLGRALGSRRDEVAIVTKFGLRFDEATRELTGELGEPDAASIRRELAASLARLGTDRVELLLLHPGAYPLAWAPAVRDILDGLVDEGLIGGHGWSTDDPHGAAVFAQGRGCIAVEHALNVLDDAPELLALCEREGLASLARSPLAMGLLARGAMAAAAPGADIRSRPPAWLRWFADGRPTPAFASRVEAVREILTSDGRTLAQGALAWIWARGAQTIPIPGFRTVAQVEENAGALVRGPLGPEQLAEIRRLLAGD